MKRKQLTNERTGWSETKIGAPVGGLGLDIEGRGLDPLQAETGRGQYGLVPASLLGERLGEEDRDDSLAREKSREGEELAIVGLLSER